MDHSSCCIRDGGGLVVLRRSSTGQFDAALSFTHVVREFDRVYTTSVSRAALCEAWVKDLSTWGAAHPRLCVMERISDSFKFFLDAQLPSDVPAVSIAPILRQIIMEFGFVADHCVVLRDTVDMQCHRYVWADVIVNHTQAYVMRERIIADLSSHDTGQHLGSYRWAGVFAGKPYEPSLPGPSLPGSVKFLKCTQCSNRAGTRRECSHCVFRGTVVAPGTMAPLVRLEFNDAGILSCETTPPPVEECFIHCAGPIPSTWRTPPGTPFCVHVDSGRNPLGGLWKSRRRQTDISPDLRALLQRVVRSIHLSFSKLVVSTRSVHRVSPDKYVVHPCGIGSHSCMKFRGEHTDSYVLFVITPRGVTQRCYSSEMLSCGVECRAREGHCSPIDETVRRELFPSFSVHQTPTISNSTQSAAYQLACRISDYHANIIRGGVGRKRNVYGDSKKAPMAKSNRNSKRSFDSREDTN